MRKAIALCVLALLVCGPALAADYILLPAQLSQEEVDELLGEQSGPQSYTLPADNWEAEPLGIVYLPYYKFGDIEDDPVSDAIDALELAIKHLDKSTSLGTTLAIYRTPAAQLRDEADRIERRDADIDRIKEILDALKRSRGVE